MRDIIAKELIKQGELILVEKALASKENREERGRIGVINLKRLKFINDLPNILETQLKLYLNDNEKNLIHLEKSLNYFDKCKEFLKIHKNNSLVNAFICVIKNEIISILSSLI